MKNFIKDHTLAATILGIALLSIIAALTTICCVNRAAPWQLLCDHEYKCYDISKMYQDDCEFTCKKCNRTITMKYVQEHFSAKDREELAKEIIGNFDWNDIWTIAFMPEETEETTFDNQFERDFNKAMDNLYN